MYDREFHTSIENDEYPQAVRLAEYIRGACPCKKIIDFGCSSGLYMRELQHVDCIGFEFSDEAVNHALCGNVVQRDLTQPLDVEKKDDTLGICLEVLEHIDDSVWRPVLENITRLCDRVIFSAALPGQGGVGHINCRPKIDWIRRFHALGWVVDLDHTKHLIRYMENGYHMGWLVNNVMVLLPGQSIP